MVTPAPRERAYVSIVGEDGDRLFGASISLPREAGARGEIGLPPLPRPPHHAVLAGDPLEQGVATIAWPFADTDRGTVVPRAIEVLIDGVPEGEVRESTRARRARWASLFLIAATGLFEVLLLAKLSRRAARKLDDHLRQASADGTVDVSRAAERGLGLELGIYGALIALAFAMLAALASFR